MWYDLTPIPAPPPPDDAVTVHRLACDDDPVIDDKSPTATEPSYKMTFDEVLDAIPPPPFAVTAGDILDALGIPRSVAERHRIRYFMNRARERGLITFKVRKVGRQYAHVYTKVAE